jgi:hypothetical protein
MQWPTLTATFDLGTRRVSVSFCKTTSSQPISDRQIGDRMLSKGAVYFVHDRGFGFFRFMAQSNETPRIMFTKSM